MVPNVVETLHSIIIWVLFGNPELYLEIQQPPVFGRAWHFNYMGSYYLLL